MRVKPEQRQIDARRVRCGCLVSIAQHNQRHGHDPEIVTNELKCGIVSDLLELDIRTLAHALRDLQDKGLIETCPPGGLRLKNIEALERVADDRL